MTSISKLRLFERLLQAVGKSLARDYEFLAQREEMDRYEKINMREEKDGGREKKSNIQRSSTSVE